MCAGAMEYRITNLRGLDLREIVLVVHPTAEDVSDGGLLTGKPGELEVAPLHLLAGLPHERATLGLLVFTGVLTHDEDRGSLS